MVDAGKLLGVDVMTGHWEFTLGAERVKEIVDQGLRRQDRISRAEREDRRLRRPGVSGVHDPRRSTACRSRSSARRIPYTPIANPRYFVADWTFGIQEESLQKIVDEARGKGAQAVVLLSHNGMDIDLKLASRVRGIDAILGGHTHDGVPAPSLVDNGGGRTLVTNAGSNGKFLAVLDLDVKGGKVADFRYKLLPVFSNLLPADPAMSALIAKVARAVQGEARGKARRHRGPALSPRQFQRHVRPADGRRPDGREERRDRVLAGISLGHVAPARAGDHVRAPDGPDGDHLPVRHRQRAHRRDDQDDPRGRRRQPVQPGSVLPAGRRHGAGRRPRSTRSIRARRSAAHLAR